MITTEVCRRRGLGRRELGPALCWAAAPRSGCRALAPPQGPSAAAAILQGAAPRVSASSCGERLLLWGAPPPVGERLLLWGAPRHRRWPLGAVRCVLSAHGVKAKGPGGAEVPLLIATFGCSCKIVIHVGLC